MSNSFNNTERNLEKYQLSNSPTLVITHKLKQQIDFLHNKVGSNEWSGELITREIGRITDLDKWTIIGEDIYLADIGAPGRTSYEVDKGGFKAVDIVEMYEAFPGLLDGTLKNHHIHTHHSMGAFFSGTDDSNLHDRALASNYFIMLIVDFKGQYVAKLAFRSKIEVEGETRLRFVNDNDGLGHIPFAKEQEREVLVIMDLKIKIEPDPMVVSQDFESRYNKVKEAVERSTPKYYGHGHGYGYPSYSGYSENGENNYGKWDSKQGKFIYADEEEKKNLDDYVPVSKRGKKKKEKKFSEMTDKEWREWRLKNEGTYKWELKHATAAINAFLKEDYTAMSFRSVTNPLWNLDWEMNKREDHKEKWAEEFVIELRDIMRGLWPGYDDEENVALLLAKVIELIAPLQHIKLVRFLLSAIGNELQEIADFLGLDKEGAATTEVSEESQALQEASNIEKNKKDYINDIEGHIYY